jgi:hypothetical protein
MARYCAISAAFFLAIHTGCTDSQTAIVTTAAASELSATEKAHDRPAAEDIARSYGNLRLLTKEPVPVDPQLATLCVGIRQQHLDDARKHSGPHSLTSIRIFMNDLAADVFGKSMAYPVGSVIVKEKQGMTYQVDYSLSQTTAENSDGVGGMIKRSPGYDPDFGDWEYFYRENASSIEHGRITSCKECHRAAASSDYVFGNWAEGGQ